MKIPVIPRFTRPDSVVRLAVAFLAAFVISSAGAGSAAAQGDSASSGKGSTAGGAVASAHPLATAAGMEILEQGGNAFDAAVAVSAALAVVEPTGSGLGGGGFWLLHRESDGMQLMVDGRETAPLAATSDMYLDENGEVVPGLSRTGPLAAGIPGEPAALAHIAAEYGTLPLPALLAPAIRYAEEGVAVTDTLHGVIRRRHRGFNEAAAEIFLPGGEVPPVGTVIVQSDLAATLRRFAEGGHDGFYSGETARLLVEASIAGGGIWTPEDLEKYQVVERAPIVFSYRGARIVSSPPPSSGGVALAQMMQILEALPPADDETGRYHQVIEAMRLAYIDRALFLGDSDFFDIDVARLSSNSYAREQAATIGPVATPSVPYEELTGAGEDTTHFSVIDGAGNRVAGTLSINFLLGAGHVAGGTGIWFNNEMDDFSAKPAVPNGYGLVGGAANSIQPGKRPLSSMTPTFLEADDQVVVLGTPGGSRIITMVLLASLGLLDDGLSLQQAIDRPRFHHQYLPDELQHENAAFSPEVASGLEQRGHTLRLMDREFGNMHAVSRDTKTLEFDAASDRRGEGGAQVLPGVGDTVSAASR